MGVGMLQHLIKHSRPDISNLVRDFSKVADGATEAHFKALLHTVKYVIATENLGSLLQPKLKVAFILKESLTVNMLDILIHVSVYMVMFYIFVEHLLHGNQKLERVLPYHPQKPNTMQHLRLLNKQFVQRTYWRKLKSKFSFQSTLNVTTLVPST
jgi:hypothetical protein